MLRVWNLSLVMATFSLTILGTFLTRSGVLDSVHSFTNSGIGPTVARLLRRSWSRSTVGLIAWRGDRLRSPGRHRLAGVARGRLPGQQPALRRVRLRRAARHGVPADRRGGQRSAAHRRARRTSTGWPCRSWSRLLFLMAVAPVLPWRKASAELLRHRLLWPAWIGVLTVVLCVAVGVRGLNPLLAFGLGALIRPNTARRWWPTPGRTFWTGRIAPCSPGLPAV